MLKTQTNATDPLTTAIRSAVRHALPSPMCGAVVWAEFIADSEKLSLSVACALFDDIGILSISGSVTVRLHSLSH